MSSQKSHQRGNSPSTEPNFSLFPPPPLQQPVLDTIKIGEERSLTLLSWNAPIRGQRGPIEGEQVFLDTISDELPDIITLPPFSTLSVTFQEKLRKRLQEHPNYAALPNANLEDALICLTLYNTAKFKGNISETYHKRTSQAKKILVADSKNDSASGLFQRLSKLGKMLLSRKAPADSKDAVDPRFEELRKLSERERIFKFECKQGKPFTFRVLNLLTGTTNLLPASSIAAANYLLEDQTTTTHTHYAAIAVGNFLPTGNVPPSGITSDNGMLATSDGTIACTYRPPKQTDAASAPPNDIRPQVSRERLFLEPRASAAIHSSHTTSSSSQSSMTLSADQTTLTDQPATMSSSSSSTQHKDPEVNTVHQHSQPPSPVRPPETHSPLTPQQYAAAVTKIPFSQPTAPSSDSTQYKEVEATAPQIQPDQHTSEAPAKTKTQPEEESSPQNASTTSKLERSSSGFFAVGVVGTAGLASSSVGIASAIAAAHPNTANTILTRMHPAWAKITVAAAGLSIGLAAIAFAILAYSFKRATQQTAASSQLDTHAVEGNNISSDKAS